MKRPVRIAITSGDQDGIGTEVVAKALARSGPRTGVQFFFWRSPNCPKAHLRKIDTHFRRVTVSSWPEAMNVAYRNSKEIVDINSLLAPPHWVEISAQAALLGRLDALATAPLSKTTITQSGFNDIGHTAILQRLSGARELHMAFVGEKFRVVIATGHIPLAEVANKLDKRTLENAIRAAVELRSLLPKNIAKLPIAVVGLNPHAGEDGLIGREEMDVFQPVINEFKDNGIKIVGPLVPDAAYFKSNWNAYSVFVAPYHDQGLIPFKMVHGHSGVHLTLGLPFTRTSVDHGTAKNIFGANKANAASMKEALDWAVRLSIKKVSSNE